MVNFQGSDVVVPKHLPIRNRLVEMIVILDIENDLPTLHVNGFETEGKNLDGVNSRSPFHRWNNESNRGFGWKGKTRRHVKISAFCAEPRTMQRSV